MSKLPRNVKPQKLVKFLVKLGFERTAAKGSHRKILSQAQLTEEELKQLK